MKKSITILGLLLGLVFFLSSWTNIHSWKAFISLEGKFKVMMPGKVVEKKSDIETAIGTLVYHTFLHQPTEPDSDNLVYMVSFCEYPPHSIHSDSLQLVNEFFETTMSSAAESVGGILQYTSEISINDFPGRVWRVDYNDGKAIIKTNAYLVGNRYYSIQTILLKEKSFNPSTDKFLDSFELID